MDAMMSFMMLDFINKNNNKDKEVEKVKTIEEKEEIFSIAKEKMKKQFIGLDPIIDTIFSQIKVWYLYPEFLTRPTVINLWGLTGVGKTNFVKCLVNYLGFTKTFCNIESMNATTSFSSYTNYGTNNSVDEYTDILTNLLECNIRPQDHCIILFDEMHQFRTLGGEDKEEYYGGYYSDLWTLLSDGSLYDWSKIIKYLRKNIRILHNHLQSAQNEDSTKSNSVSERMYISMGIAVPRKEENAKRKPPTYDDQEENMYKGYNGDTKRSMLDRFNTDRWNPINCDLLVNLIDIDNDDIEFLRKLRMQYYGVFDTILQDFQIEKSKHNLSQLLNNCSRRILLEFLTRKYNQILNDQALTTADQLEYNDRFVYSKMLVFICGNIDPDLYTENKIRDDITFDKPSLDELKEFLSDRFPPEQISRFGHNYIIYPVLSMRDYDTIIMRETALREKQLQNKFNDNTLIIDKKEVLSKFHNLEFDVKSGVRPALSSVNLILSEMIPQMLLDRININKSKEEEHGDENEDTGEVERHFEES